MRPIVKEASYVPRYLLVGGASAVTDYSVFNYCIAEWGEADYLWALGVAILSAYVVNFLGHKYISFTVREQGIRQLLKHGSMKLTVFSLRFGLMYVLVNQLGFGVSNSYLVGFTFGFFTFLGSRWIFTGSSPKELLVLLWSYVPEKLKRVIRFCSSGVVGFAVFYAVLYVLTEHFGIWYLASSMISLVLNYSITFVMQKFLTFNDRSTHVLGRQILLYAGMVSGFYATNTALLYLFVESFGLWYMFAQLLISVLLTVVSYLISRRLFAPKPPDA